MIRWRLCLALAGLLLLPEIYAKSNNDDDDDEDTENKEDLKIPNIPKLRRRGEEVEEDDDDDDEDEEEEGGEKLGGGGGGNSINDIGGGSEGAAGGDIANKETPIFGKRPLPLIQSPKPLGMAFNKTTKKRPLECYVCAYKAETPLRACLDPTKFRVHTITCHSVDDKCFTSVISKGETYEAVVRGCRSSCVGSPETTCCDINRCNNQAFAMPLIQPRAALSANTKPAKPSTPKSMTSAGTVNKSCFPPTILFFISILLILQTVSKVVLV